MNASACLNLSSNEPRAHPSRRGGGCAQRSTGGNGIHAFRDAVTGGHAPPGAAASLEARHFPSDNLLRTHTQAIRSRPPAISSENMRRADASSLSALQLPITHCSTLVGRLAVLPLLTAIRMHRSRVRSGTPACFVISPLGTSHSRACRRIRRPHVNRGSGRAPRGHCARPARRPASHALPLRARLGQHRHRRAP